MLYAVGDIHGSLPKLEALLDELPLGNGDEFVFVGDYVDRGSYARGVIDRLIALEKEWPCTFLIGNHESMFLDYIGWKGELYDKGEYFLALVPHHRAEGYLFVHAGLGVPELGLSDVDEALERAQPSDLLWNRMAGDLRHLLGVTLVYGHSPDPTLQVRWNMPYSIGIDTGAVYGGPLTAIALPSERLFQAGDEGGPPVR
ncbi:MAG: serine/threonine protein phosphatase [Deltaproteobacteria bacterium]|nr:serine/threonine protein phosphatase [Deltaproteobacteria bacterium]